MHHPHFQFMTGFANSSQNPFSTPGHHSCRPTELSIAKPYLDVPMQIEEAIQFLKLFVCSYALRRSVLDHLDEVRPS